MRKRIEDMRRFFIYDKKHHAYRKKTEDLQFLAKKWEAEGASPEERALGRIHYMLDNETPVVFADERITLVRTLAYTPVLFTDEEYDELKRHHWIHESGDYNNFAPDYSMVLNKGFRGIRSELEAAIKRFESEGSEENAVKARDMKNTLEAMNALQAFTERYRSEAERVGNENAAGLLKKIPEYPAESLIEACQMIRILNYGMWIANNYQCSLGRLDRILTPFYEADKAKGVIDYEDGLEIIEELFLSLNRDSDFYDGVQQGDNGQSFCIGGRNKDGSDSFNEMSQIMLDACRELKLIDPKLNLRCDKNTPLERFIEGTRLTREGIGFPQYANDDVIIPALIRWGYDEDDAYNYCVAACWEPIIPGKDTTVVNCDGMNFPLSVLKVVERIEEYPDFEGFEKACLEEVKKDAERICDTYHDLYYIPCPMVTFMVDGCIESGFDAAKGLRYNNVGVHGVAISVAADSMAAIRKLYYEDKVCSAQRLHEALSTDFAVDKELKAMMMYDVPKMGNDEDEADDEACKLMSAFADALAGKKADRGVFRAGTGSAMYYIWHGEKLPATPDGRGAFEPLPANYSPSISAHAKGPVSTVKSFTKPDLIRAANGGPLTIEIHNSVFASEGSLEKVASLVRLYILRGGHELQINSVNREAMIDAQKHPENYRNMIVRVWGWSGYFVELEKEYQDQIIKRAEFSV